MMGGWLASLSDWRSTRVVCVDGTMRWLDVVVRTRWRSGRVVGKTEERWVKRVLVVV